ncbi:MAG: Peptidase inhibitor family [Kribbellaceae bacterium]|jgi:hypothetical protein|nr:Peptidase inhibitor family [Kribbellaceae bacterium]
MKALRIVAMTLAAAGAAIGLATPAHAVDRMCYSGNWCVYADIDYKINDANDYMYRFNAADYSWADGNGGINNADSSWRNYWSVPVRVYKEGSYAGGEEICVAAGTNRTGGRFTTWDDTGESHRYNGFECN